ncbi:hypothetical protein [Endozoicomonas atrinae]|uniref:DUF7210 family protein n=1 Tax=Endozoicomonas atrinae TaxID=1333660 RepID=UPI0008255E48|nr:hypothetical protein [Endozoicomonas atrinae]
MKYTALHSVRHDGQLYQAGETLELDDTAADTLLACQAVESLYAEDGSDPAPDSVALDANYAESEPASNANEKSAKGKAKK